MVSNGVGSGEAGGEVMEGRGRLGTEKDCLRMDLREREERRVAMERCSVIVSKKCG